MEKKNNVFLICQTIIIILLIVVIIALVTVKNKNSDMTNNTEKNETKEETKNVINDESLLGTYRLISCKKDNDTVDCKYIFGSSLDNSYNLIELLDDNNFKLGIAASVNEEGKYTKTDTTLKFETDSGYTMKGIIKDNKIELNLSVKDYLGQNVQLVFEKQEKIKDESILGMYNLTTCKKDSSVIECQEIFGSSIMRSGNAIELLADDRFKLYIGSSLREEGTYVQVDTTLKFQTDSGYKMTGIVKNDEIELSLNVENYADQNIELILKKQ